MIKLEDINNNLIGKLVKYHGEIIGDEVGVVVDLGDHESYLGVKYPSYSTVAKSGIYSLTIEPQIKKKIIIKLKMKYGTDIPNSE